MPERFIPLSQLTGGQPTAPGGQMTAPGGPAPSGSARFVPLGSGASGLNLPSLFTQFQGLPTGPSTADVIARGAGGLGTGLGAINQAGNAYSYFTGNPNPIPSSVGSAIGAAGNVLGLGSGIYNLAQGNYSAAPGVVSSALGLGGMVWPVLSQVAGTLALPLAGVGIGLSNMYKKEQERARRQTIESGDIRRGYAEAVPNVVRAMETARILDRVNALPPEQQVPALQQARQILELGMADLTADFSRFVGTGGQGGAASKVGKVDTSEAQRLSLEAGPDITIGLARVLDALAQRGVVLPAGEVGPTTYQSPASLLNSIIGQAGVPAGSYDPYTALTPEMLANIGPGNLEAFVTQTLGQLNPQFASSQIGQRFGTLPTISQPAGAGTILQTVMPQYLAAQNALVQNALANTTGDPNQGGLNASNIRFFLPYAPGAEAARQAGLPAMQERFEREFAERQAATMTGGN